MSGENEPVTCVIADDHPAVLEAVAEFLTKSGIEIVARAHDGEEALEKLRAAEAERRARRRSHAELGGIELARRASRLVPDTAIVLYTGYGDRAELTEVLDAGVRGFVLKEAPMDDVTRAVLAVASGGTYVDPVLAGALASSMGSKSPPLTQRERDVLRLLAAASRTRRSASGSSSRRKRCAPMCARRWTSSTPTRARRQSPAPCEIN